MISESILDIIETLEDINHNNVLYKRPLVGIMTSAILRNNKCTKLISERFKDTLLDEMINNAK